MNPTKLKASTDLQNESDVLDLSDDLLTAQTKIRDENFSDLLAKVNAFVSRSKEEKFDKSDFLCQWQIIDDFLKLIEKHEKSLTDEDLSILEKAFVLFSRATDNVDPYNMLTTDLDESKRIFYMYFNLFNNIIVQNYLKHAEKSIATKILCRLCICKIFAVMTYTCKLADLGLQDLERPMNCIELLSFMFNYLKHDFQSLELTEDPSITSFNILSLMIWYTDKTILVRDFMDAGCSQIMMDILAIICLKPELHHEFQLNVIVVLYNISRHDDGVKELTDLKTSDLIKTYQSNKKNIRIDIACYMTLVLLSTPEEIKQDSKRMNDILDKLLEKVYDASVSSEHRANGELHLSEVLIVFVKLSNDDYTLNYIMEQSSVSLHASTKTEFFIHQLVYHYCEISDENSLKQATCTALVNILWSLSFQSKYQQQLKNAGTKFKEIIVKLTKKIHSNASPNQYVPKYIEDIQKAAAGLLYNIYELIPSATESVISDHQQSMIMISYSHEDLEFCKQLYNEILNKRYDIWIDFKFLKTGDLWEQIAAGMKRANVIVCLMSEDYCKSKSCRWEATYALDKLQSDKLVIPVLLQKYSIPDWLEIRIAMLKYVRFRNLKQLENEKLSELIDMIECSLPRCDDQNNLNGHTSLLASHHESTTSTPIVPKLENLYLPSISSSVSCLPSEQSLHSEKPIEQWDKNDISQWFQENYIRAELRDLCQFEDGHELLDYAEIFLNTKQLQYQLYSNEFLRKDGIESGQRPLLLHEFTKFSNALRKLKMTIKSTS